MTTINQIYKCPICGNVIEIIHPGAGQLICCGQLMELLQTKTEDTGYEKHLPVVEKFENKITVKVGSVLHPMEKAHYIELIEIITDDKVYKKFLKPNDKAEAIFEISADNITIRAYCNVHGLWQTK